MWLTSTHMTCPSRQVTTWWLALRVELLWGSRLTEKQVSRCIQGLLVVWSCLLICVPTQYESFPDPKNTIAFLKVDLPQFLALISPKPQWWWKVTRIPCHFLPENWENNAIKLVVLLCFILVETPWTSWIYETSCNLHPTCSASGSDQVIHLIRKYVHHMDTVTKTRLVDALQRQHDFYVNRLQQELVVELLESTTGDELRMMLARQLPIWDVFHMARSSHSLQSRGAATQNDWPPIELFLVGSLAFSNFWCSQVRMKDILDEGGDFYNLHKLVFHDLDPEMCFGCKRHGQNMCFLFRSCPAPFMMFPYMCSFFPNS